MVSFRLSSLMIRFCTVPSGVEVLNQRIVGNQSFLNQKFFGGVLQCADGFGERHFGNVVCIDQLPKIFSGWFISWWLDWRGRNSKAGVAVPYGQIVAGHVILVEVFVVLILDGKGLQVKGQVGSEGVGPAQVLDDAVVDFVVVEGLVIGSCEFHEVHICSPVLMLGRV